MSSICVCRVIAKCTRGTCSSPFGVEEVLQRHAHNSLLCTMDNFLASVSLPKRLSNTSLTKAHVVIVYRPFSRQHMVLNLTLCVLSTAQSTTSAPFVHVKVAVFHSVLRFKFSVKSKKKIKRSLRLAPLTSN